MAAAIQFKKAVKFESKGRVALVGPAGSGKSFTALMIARMLVGPEGKIAAVDTEHGSLSKYAHTMKCGGPGVCEDASHHDFDVVELSDYSPGVFKATLRAAEQAGYDAFVTDSLSHFWMGKNGALEFVDNAKRRSSSKDDMSGWKDFRPHERAMVDAMIASPMHIVCTMRTKTAYEEQINERTGKKQRVKIGLAPVQREGLEYEFDLVGYMDDENTLIVDKTRCSELSGKALSKPSAADLDVFREWLKGDARPASPAPSPAASGPALVQPQQAQVALPWSYKLGELICQPLSAARRVTTDGAEKKFVAVKLNGVCEGKNIAFCWESTLFDALDNCPNKKTQLQVQLKDGFLDITDVDFIDGVEYREGQPYVEPAPRAQEQPLEITDDDIPF
jgi:energy-coupling factor transporter ATP-binding protein EcfA2